MAKHSTRKNSALLSNGMRICLRRSSKSLNRDFTKSKKQTEKLTSENHTCVVLRSCAWRQNGKNVKQVLLLMEALVQVSNLIKSHTLNPKVT